jgi:hypothetical protein
MKLKIFISLFLVSFFWTSCSKKQTVATNQSDNPTAQTTTGVPFQPTLVEPPETKEIYAIKNQSDSLIALKDFDNLDAVAEGFRNSQASYANGVWKLSYFYEGLNFPSGEATDSEWTNHLAILRDWVQAKPDSITARVALANGVIDYAWQARGHDFADKVKDEAWKLYFQRLNQAVIVLNGAKNLKEKCPYWWAVMLRAELGLQTERPEYDATFNTAIQTWPNYTPFYFLRSNFLLPRWYGSDGELQKDLDQSANKIGGEAGDMIYAQVIWNLNGMVSSTNLFEEYNFSWERANKGFEAIEKLHPDSLAVKNEAAHLAALAGDIPAAKKYFNQTAGQIDLSCWSSTNEFVSCVQFVYGSAQ